MKCDIEQDHKHTYMFGTKNCLCVNSEKRDDVEKLCLPYATDLI